MAQHLQMQGIRTNLSARGMAIRQDNGDFIVSHKDDRYPETVRGADLMAVYCSGIRMAANRESDNKFQQGAR